jgi:hypothetical protein
LGKIRFNDKVFKDGLGAWVKATADPDFDRAWKVVLGCLAVHAKLDKQDGQSAAQSKRETFQDFALAFEGEDATYTMVGMVHELEQMCPMELREDGSFEKAVADSIAAARGEEVEETPAPAKQRVVSRPAKPKPKPKLELLEGGKHE